MKLMLILFILQGVEGMSKDKGIKKEAKKKPKEDKVKKEKKKYE